MIHCDCCGDGCLEIKFPFMGREKFIFGLLGDDLFWHEENAITKLNVNDNYYYQIQCQLFVTKKNHCDFFVWTTKDWHLERISIDKEFCHEMIAQSRKFFKLYILPEILGKFYSRRPVLNNIANQANYVQQIEPVIKDQGQKAKTYCYCKKENVGTTMTECDNVECEIEWFHVNCLQLENIPKGKWYCPDCHKFNHGKRRKNKNSCSI